MPLETATVISDLVTSNPAHSDGLNNADAHIRMIKASLKASFPNVNAPVSTTLAALNAVGTAGSVGAPSVNFGASTEGLYKLGTGQTGITGQLIGNGAKVTGEIGQFIVVPPSLKSGGDATASKYQWLELDGGTYLASTYPELYAAGVASGTWTTGTTFTVPNLTGTSRFLRSRGSVGFMVAQSNQIGVHNHTGTTDSQGAHSHGGLTGSQNAQHTHIFGITYTGFTAAFGAGGVIQSITAGGSSTTSVTQTESGNHQHAISSDGAHVHNLTVNNTGGSETRPEALSVIMAIKT